MMAEPSSAEDKFMLEVGIALDQKSLTQFQKDYLQAMEKMVKAGATINQAQMRLGDGERFAGTDPQAIKRVNDGLKQMKNEMSGVAQESSKVAVNVQKAEVHTKGVAKQAVDARESFQDLNKGVDLGGMYGLGGGGGAGKFAGFSGMFTKWSASLTDFGAIAKGVFGSVIGITAVESIKKLIDYMGEAVEEAAKFERSLLTIELGVRAMQRQGTDISVAKMFEAIEMLQEKYKIFTEQDIVQGTTIFVNNLRELGATEEQVIQLMEIAAKTASLSGKTFEETAKIINLAGISGYSRTLNSSELGVPYTVKLAQQEATRLGYVDKTFAQLDAQTKTLVVISLLNREIADYDQDILKIQETSFGQMQDQQRQLEQIKKDLGESILPAWVMILDIIKRVVEQLTAALSIVLRPISITILAIETIFLALTGHMDEAMTKYMAFMTQIKALVNDIITLIIGNDIATLLGRTKDLPVQMGDIPEGEKGSTSTAEEDYAAGVIAVTTEFEDDRLKIEEDYAKKSADIESDRAEKITDANLDLARDLEDIDRDLARNREKAAQKYESDMEKISRDAANKQAEVARKYAEAELEAERELQNKLRELRDQALFDLEEAARMGDALSARKILRQYRFDKDQAIKGAEKGKIDRRTKFEQELADIRREAAERRAERELEFAQELVDLDIQAARKREDANRAYQQKLADIKKWAQREIETERQKYKQELADLQKKIDAEIAMLKQAQAEKEAIAKKTVTYGGDEYSFNDPNKKTVTFLGQKYTFVGGQAEGGQFIANKPTMAMFGEAGAEMATFTPLSGVGSRSGNLGGVGGSGGKLALEILLSPGLVADIIENTLTEMGNVITSVERSR